MKIFTRFWIIGYTCIAGSLAAQSSGKDNGGSFSINHTFTDLGTREEASREINGTRVIYPVDEEELINRLLPKIAEFRKKRSIQAPLEAKAIRETFAAPETRAQVLSRVRSLLGVEALSDDIDEVYDHALKDIDSLTSQWVQWSGEIGTVHLFNYATVKPFREGATQVHFDQLHYLIKPNGEFIITLHPPFIFTGIGMGVFDPTQRVIAPFSLDIFNVAAPGTPVKTVAADLDHFLDLVINLQRQLVSESMAKIASNHLLESLLLHEIETQFFSPNPPRTLTRGLARFYLFAHLLLSNEGGKEADQSMLVQMVYSSFPTEAKNSLKRINELKQLDLLGEVPPEYETAVSRILALALIQLSQSTDKGSPPFRLFTEKGIEMPKGGFNRRTFTDAIKQAYPNSPQQFLKSREEVITLLQQSINRKSGGAKKKLPAEPIIRPARISKDIGGTKFSYPPSLESAVAVIAPEWSKGLRKVRTTLRSRFEDSFSVSPSVVLSDDELKSIERFGIPAARDTADHFSKQVAILANIGLLFIRTFEAEEVQIWIREDLDKFIQSGGEVEGFALDSNGKELTFNLLPSVTASTISESWLEDMVRSFDEIPFPALPAIADSEGDLASAPLSEQVAAIKEGGNMITQIIMAADTMTPEQMLQKPIRSINEQQAFFIIVHEVVEAGLITKIIGSSDRRWFCDGMANLIAIHECDRKFGKGAGIRISESLFSPERSRSLASQINLLSWPAAGNENPSLLDTDGLNKAHYYYATRALLAATKNRDENFISEWIGKIRETPWNRTNAETVLTAFHDLTEEDLSEILKLSPTQ